MRVAFILALAAAAAASGCNMLRQPAVMIPQTTSDWRSVATADDRTRLRDWRSAFVGALAAARAAGHGADIAREGALLVPDAALAGPSILDGDYRCRIIKLGAKSQGMLDYIAYPFFTCRIDTRTGANGTRRHFTKLTGSQRHVGLIYPSDQLRSVFLGTLVLGDEAGAYRYGVDPERDVAGWVERIGDRRWRIVLPYPHYESTLDLIELIPEQ